MKLGFERRIVLSLIAGGALCATFAQAALAQDTNSYLYLAHAAPGRNISSTTNPALPIDISANGTCIAEGLGFGEIRGPFTMAAGTIAFRISKANSEAPCSEPAVFTGNTPLAAGTTHVGAIYLSGTNIFAQVFAADLSPLAVGQARALVLNASPQSLSATITNTPTTDGSGGQNVIPARTIRSMSPPLGFRYTSIYLTGTNTLEAGPHSIEIQSRNLYLYVLAGVASNGSVQLLGPKVIGDVF
jgi:hypothetical protein